MLIAHYMIQHNIPRQISRNIWLGMRRPPSQCYTINKPLHSKQGHRLLDIPYGTPTFMVGHPLYILRQQPTLWKKSPLKAISNEYKSFSFNRPSEAEENSPFLYREGAGPSLGPKQMDLEPWRKTIKATSFLLSQAGQVTPSPTTTLVLIHPQKEEWPSSSQLWATMERRVDRTSTLQRCHLHLINHPPCNGCECLVGSNLLGNPRHVPMLHVTHPWDYSSITSTTTPKPESHGFMQWPYSIVTFKSPKSTIVGPGSYDKSAFWAPLSRTKHS